MKEEKNEFRTIISVIVFVISTVATFMFFQLTPMVSVGKTRLMDDGEPIRYWKEDIVYMDLECAIYFSVIVGMTCMILCAVLLKVLAVWKWGLLQVVILATGFLGKYMMYVAMFNNMVDYYGCPNSKRTQRLQLKKRRKNEK